MHTLSFGRELIVQESSKFIPLHVELSPDFIFISMVSNALITSPA